MTWLSTLRGAKGNRVGMAIEKLHRVENDLVVALDSTHARVLRQLAPTEADAAKVHLLSAFDPQATAPDVPDPYYAGPEVFDDVLAMIERACRSLFRQLEPALRTTTRHASSPDADPIGDP